jgi:hypothetical protein
MLVTLRKYASLERAAIIEYRKASARNVWFRISPIVSITGNTDYTAAAQRCAFIASEATN